MNYNFPAYVELAILITNDETGQSGTAKLSPSRVGGLTDEDYLEAIRTVRQQLEQPWRLMTPEEAIDYHTQELGLGRIAVAGTPESWEKYDGPLEAMTGNEAFLDMFEGLKESFEGLDDYERGDALDSLEDALVELSGDALTKAKEFLAANGRDV